MNSKMIPPYKPIGIPEVKAAASFTSEQEKLKRKKERSAREGEPKTARPSGEGKPLADFGRLDD